VGGEPVEKRIRIGHSFGGLSGGFAVERRELQVEAACSRANGFVACRILPSVCRSSIANSKSSGARGSFKIE